jgi:uncharacterized membrane protein
MSAERTVPALSRQAFGLSMALLGVVGLIIGDWLSGQAAPKAMPDRAAWSYVPNALIVLSGAAIVWRRTAAWGAAALGLYYGVVVVLLLGGRLILRNLGVYGAYSSEAEQLAVAAAAVIVWAGLARPDSVLADRLTRVAQIAFGLCAVLFGGAHFAYMNLTAPLVPAWLPPSQVFWGYATGVFHILGGLAIIANVRARLAALLLAVMYAAFTPLVHIPNLAAHPHDHFIWNESTVNVVLAACAWVVADSLGRLRRSG